MAVIYWTGNQRARAWSNTCTVTAAATSGTITATVNGKADVYTVTAADTSVSLAAASAAAQWATSLIPELSGQFTISASGAVITVTGPEDGRPVAVTFSASGGSTTVTSGTAVTATSPNDANDAANYSSGSIPTNGDTLVFENNSVSCLYNLDAFDTETVALVRRASHGGQIGLPDTNPLGFPEYLDKHLETTGTSLTVEDNGVFCRFLCLSASAVTATITGPGGGAVNAETVELTGTSHASSVINLNGGSLALAPLGAQTAVAGTVRVANGAAFRTGAGATLTTVTVINSQAEIAGPYTTMLIDRGSEVTTRRAAAAATSTTVEDGTLNWGSTGTWGALNVGSGGTVDATAAPSTIATGTITLYEGCTFLDPNERTAKTYNLVIVGEIANMTIDLGTSYNLAVS